MGQAEYVAQHKVENLAFANVISKEFAKEYLLKKQLKRLGQLQN